MTLSTVPSGQTSSWSPGVRFSRANAFRVLSVPADTELKEIYRQQQRLLVALEIGGLDGTRKGTLLPLSDVSKEEILEAVHRLERPDDRFIEELFWVHEMDCGDLVDGHLDNVVGALRGSAASNTTRGAVARHNLAVLLSILGQELAGNCRFEYWEEALKTWRKVIDDDLFLTFMEGRARKCDGQISDTGMMRASVRRQLSSTFSEELAHAIKSRDLTAVNALAKIAVEHRSWLELDAALDSVGKQAIKDGYVSLGAILDRLSGITQQDNKANARNSLVEREKELQSVANEYGAIVRSLGEPADAVGWDDAITSSYHKLSVAYFNLLDDRQQAIRLIVQAREFAHDPQLLRSMERDWQHVQRAILCREADVLMRRGDFGGADHKLAAALGVSTEEQKIEIKAAQDRCRWASVLRGADTRKTNPILYTLGGVGAMLYGKLDYDPGTRSYVANHWLTFLFCPIFPLGAYRITDADSRSYCIHGKVPLSGFLNIARWAIPTSVMAVVLVVVLMAVKSRGTSAEAEGPTSTVPITPTETAGAAEGRPPISTGVQHSTRDDIEEEQTALSVLAQSLEDRKRVLDAEGAKLDKQKRYLAGVESSYSRERVPNGGRSLYEALLADHNDRVKNYNKKLAALKEDFAAYTERANSLNVRIQIFNRFR
jgi:hypothetical protein